ncbi:RrF2 family transcriptional regulator [Gaetbulibacter aestuarii]|uniref:Rrf2 family transcriptional regulator n=1 Tax=Gaetbulibacter aestuarii TaxID=1502358 RepID=A0ABW7N4L8_9FLAO
MFSNSSKYAIKAVLFLAIHSDENNKIMVKDIADPINVPQAYIAKLLQELAKHKLISSTRGPKGGFFLSQDDKQGNVLDIIKVIDDDKKLNSCMLSLKFCNASNPCPIHHLVSQPRDLIINNLKSKTILELAIHVENGTSRLPL